MTTTPTTPTTEATEVPSRRALLRVAGIGGLVVAGAAAGTTAASAAPLAAAKADKADKPATDVVVATTVAQLVGWQAKKLDDGTVAQLLGHAKAGDGAARLVRYDARSTARPNGGTVLAPADAGARGRWHTLHTGTADFRWFGLFGPQAPADDALDALVGDASVSRIEAHSDLAFVRRHRFTRSHLELDFGGHTMTTEGIEDAGQDDPFAAVLFFRGTVTDDVRTNTLTAVMPELRDDYEVADSSRFEVGQWYALEVNALSGRWEKELQRLVQVTQVVDATHVRVNYKAGWELAKGRTLTWTRVEPVEQVHVRHLSFVGRPDGDQYTGSHPIAYEYAVGCDVEDVHGVATFWPLVMRRWSTFFRTSGCSLTNPASVTWGGAGYLTQQIYCNYGHVVDCHTSNARHLNDWTASSYGLVENCHGDGDDQGPFVTHGQYEHDLTYVGNSGLMTFANSGAAWGSSAKRITVTRHVCSWFVARVKVTDLTLTDVQVIRKEGLAGSGMMWVNADGVQLRGCQADDTLIVSQASDRSARPNVIEGSRFAVLPDTPVTQANVTRPVHLVRTALSGLRNASFAGSGPVVLEDCVLEAAEGAGTLTVSGDVTVRGGVLRNVALVAAGAKDQTVRAGGGARLEGAPAGGAFLSRRAATATVTWALDGLASTAGDGTAHAVLTQGTNRWAAVGSRFAGGRVELAPAAFGEGSTLVQTGTVEQGVTRTAFPEDGPRVATAGSLVL
ncbi:peptidase C14 [Isoptericola sp. NPDC057559]|uniref:peptidase C14 n=1 Tax=Isoptericola sp. NPDC057559 TaxID=3346168 RepID=UPI0036B9EDC7